MRWRESLTAAACALACLCGACGSSGHGATSTGAGPPAKCSDSAAGCNSDVALRLSVNHCPQLEYLFVGPTTLKAGESAHLDAIATDPDGDAVDYDWTATGGRLSGSAREENFDTYTCLVPGTQVVTLWFFDSRGCDQSEGTNVECVPR